MKTVNGYPLSYLSIDFGPKPYNTGDGMRALADYAEEQGVEIFYNTEAKQLVGDADSGITALSPRALMAISSSMPRRALFLPRAITRTTTR